MKKLILLTLALMMLTGLCAGEEALVDTLLTDIERFEAEGETPLPLPEDELLILSADSEVVTLAVNRLQSYGISYQQLMTSERFTCLPAAALCLAVGEHYGFVPEETQLTIYAARDEARLDLYCIIIHHADDRMYLLRWFPGSAAATCQRGRGIANFLNVNAQAIAAMTQVNTALLPPYYSELRNGGYSPLSVGYLTFSLSEDRQSIYLDRPAITGGSGRVTVAYNIYDSLSNPINYFYSDEARVAATPGCGGLFNIFVVVTDAVTGETVTRNIGWQQVAWPRADQLTVSGLTSALSPDGLSIFVDRPSVACRSGEATIAYNLYDSEGRPVNYFYSVAPRVAVTPGYSGRFNVFVVVTDTATGEQSTQDIGWIDIGGAPLGTRRALLIGQASVPGRTSAGSYLVDCWNLEVLLKALDGGAYNGHTSVRQNLSRAEVLSAIAEAYHGAKAGDVSFFYIGAHGVRNALSGDLADQEGALCCADGSNLKLKDLASALAKANPENEVIVVLSSSGSGAAVKGRQEEALRARQVISAFAAADHGLAPDAKRQEMRRNHFHVLTATDVYEADWYYPDSDPLGSFMGLALTRALTQTGGACEADANRDRKIEFEELFAFVYNYCYNASASADSRQHVQRWPEGSVWTAFSY